MQRSRSLAKRLPAGIVDASFASLATFVVGLAAVNLLPSTERGVYAVYFTTFMLGTVLPRNLIFTPSEVEAVGFPVERRIPLIGTTIALGAGPAVLGAVASAGLATIVTAPLTTSEVIIPFTVTTATAAILSPLQDHVRKMLHIGMRSWLAASVSIVQFVAAASAILIMMQADIALAWIPFGSLTIANFVSVSFGWVLTRGSHHRSTTDKPLRFGDLARRGRWLLLQAAAPSFAGFLAASIITRLASAEALGFAEAARVVAQPILVFATGLTAVLAPRTVEAAMHHDERLARRTSAIYLGAISIAGFAYLAIAGWSWALNPMARIVPAAYEFSGLVALTIFANMWSAGIYLQVNELLGAKRETTLARLSWIVSPIVLIGAATASFTEAFARPLGRSIEAITRFGVQQRVIANHYRRKSPRDDSNELQDALPDPIS